MILYDNKEKIMKFLICMNILLLVLLVCKTLFYKESNDKEYNYVSTSLIKTETEDTNIYVEYPRFNKNDDVNKIITDFIYNYIKEFKSKDGVKSLDITYNTYYIENFVNITFNINNSISREKNRNIIINLNKNELAYINSLFDKDYLENEINKLIYSKYHTDIYNKIINENLSNYTYIIGTDSIEVYFNNIEWNDIDYIPYVIINLDESISYTNTTNTKKYIAFTYDDGPSEYTLDILKILEKNGSSATFFVIGNKIKAKEDVIKKINNSSSEVGSHGYTHSNFTKLNAEELKSEINSTNILLKSITNNKSFLIRPPYGDYDEKLVNMDYNIVLWNIDSKDWLVKDSDKIYNNVIKNACDGCIVLMHDAYEETVEATKKIITELNNMGYTIVSVSKLMEIKKYNNDSKSIISYIK